MNNLNQTPLDIAFDKTVKMLDALTAEGGDLTEQELQAVDYMRAEYMAAIDELHAELAEAKQGKTKFMLGERYFEANKAIVDFATKVLERNPR